MKHHNFENVSLRLAGVDATREFLEPIFFDRDREIMVVAFCDDHLRVIKILTFPGSKVAVEISLRDIFRGALDYTAILLAHNHPSGNPEPSGADFALTHRFGRACEALSITLLDHLILGRDKTFSFRRAGLL